MLLLTLGCQPHGGNAANTALSPTTAATSSAGATSSGPATPEPPQQPTTPAPASTTRTHHIRAAAPTELAIPAIHLKIGYDQSSVVSTVVSSHAAGQWTITPPEATWTDLQSAYWWSEQQYSAPPADPSTGTTFLYLHACLHVICAGNHLHDLQPGNTIDLSTGAGTLRYTVIHKLRLDKTPQGVGNNTTLYSYGRHNQLRLITCGYAPDGTSPFNWAIIATLHNP